ncbi:hypothetical protein BDV93DRAFT_607281 [Ceratobasidium sp. AG-I]|nr:hypothetical protein BDV93DRAFT_607281 [Ceratobasidium sp. AG-I]
MACDTFDLDIIDFATRLAIYLYAFCSAILGLVTLFNTEPRRGTETTEDFEKYVVKAAKDVDQSVVTSTLTGIALIAAALVHEHWLHKFSLFHAYIVLLLLWVITLTGMWFVIHIWVFDILRKGERRMDTRWFFHRVLTQSKWFLLQFSLMGGYGLYVTLRQEHFGPPNCTPQLFKNKTWSIFLYAFSIAPVVNACMLFILTSIAVWILSVGHTVYSERKWSGHVSPRAFCVFWFIQYICVEAALVTSIETQLRDNTRAMKWPFGSTLALALIVVPLRVVIVRTWQLCTRKDKESKLALHSRMGSREYLYRPEESTHPVYVRRDRRHK